MGKWDEAFPKRVQRLRTERGLTEAELATQLRVSTRDVNHWERGWSVPLPGVVDRLKRLAGDSLDDIDSRLDPRFDGDAYSDDDSLIAIGLDSGAPMLVRRAALREVGLRTGEHAFSPKLVNAYESLVNDEHLDLEFRLILADDISYNNDPLRERHLELLAEARRAQGVKPWVELAIAREIGGVSALLLLSRLATSDDRSIREPAHSLLRNLATNDDEPDAVRRAAFESLLSKPGPKGHVFVSYVREDERLVHQLTLDLEARGVPTWTDRSRLRPGVRWRDEITNAIRGGDAFVAVFSTGSEERSRSYMREELSVAVEELRLRPRQRAWFFPVLLSPCEVPRLRIGAGEDLTDLQWQALYTDWNWEVDKLAWALKEVISGRVSSETATHDRTGVDPSTVAAAISSSLGDIIEKLNPATDRIGVRLSKHPDQYQIGDLRAIAAYFRVHLDVASPHDFTHVDDRGDIWN